MSAPAPATYPAPPAADGPPRWPVRVWPGAVILAGVVLLMVVPGRILPRTMVHFITMFAGPLLGAILAVGWWVFAARARGRDRWLYPVLLLVPVVVLAVALFRGSEMLFAVYSLPLVLAAWVFWLALTPGMAAGNRRVGLAAVMIAAWASLCLVRIDGADEEVIPTLRWRWQKTPEEEFLAERASRTVMAVAAAEVVVRPGDWPGFRGAARDGRLTGVTIDTDWSARPPELVWKHRVGPGWGSFAVVGDRLFTQEQRGTDEAVVCYAADSGAEVWEHRWPARFQEAIAGPGPRATPTIHDGRLYAQGATGKLVCLDAATGRPHWTADLTADVGGVVPTWGYAGSPLLTGGHVIVYAGGPGGKGTAAYKADSGALAWAAGKASHSYSSPHPATLGGVPQVLLVSDFGIESFDPTDGKILWENDWHAKGLNRVTQPAVLSDTDVVFGTGVGNDQGTRRLRVTKTAGGWDVKTVWTTRAMRPYFNDGVVHKGHLFGFDGSRFCCINLEDGREAWKEGSYGAGQVVLLADQGVLVVQADDGRVVLVEADPAGHTELGTLAAIKEKTWNHPVVAHGLLFVRNGQEAACYRLRPAVR